MYTRLEPTRLSEFIRELLLERQATLTGILLSDSELYSMCVKECLSNNIRVHIKAIRHLAEKVEVDSEILESIQREQIGYQCKQVGLTLM